MTSDERIEASDALDSAEEMLSAAIGHLKEFARITGRRDLEPYIIAHLGGWLDGDNRYDATAIPRLRASLDEAEEEDDNARD